MLNESYRLVLALAVTGSVAGLAACSSKFRSAGSSDEPALSTTGTVATGTIASVGSMSSSGTGGMGSSSSTTSTTGSTLVHCEVGTPECECGVAGCFLVQGASCTQAADCMTQVCGVTQEATNICCAMSCQQGQVCLADGSGCELEGACDEADQRCSAEGNHERCTDGVWQLVAACGTRGCSLELTGGCLGDLGTACLQDSECGVGTCKETTDGSSVCCDVSCGDCHVCDDTGSACEYPDQSKPDCNCREATAWTCDDNIPCTDDACDSGRCSNELQSGYCLIDDECVDHNESEAGNPCRYCDTTIRAEGWTNSSNTVSCDDGAWCNGVDTCDGSGQCEHEFRTDRCSDYGGCTLGTCDEARDSCYLSGTACLTVGEFTCESTSCGGDVLGRVVTTSCSGLSYDCDGLVSATNWEINTGCSVIEKCNPNTLQCEAAPECE